MPFIFDDLMLMAALGAGGGALFNKKDPLKGALIGAGLGAGGAALPGLLGAGAGTTAAEMAAAQEAGSGLMGAGNLGWGGATTGIQGGLNAALGSQAGASAGGLLSGAGEYAKPVMQGVQVAQSMMPNEQPIQAPQLLPPTASPNLAQIAGQDQQMAMQQTQTDQARRDRMMARIAAMRGY